MAYIKKRSYIFTHPDGRKEKRKTAHYSIRTTVDGKHTWTRGYSDLAASRQLAAKMEAADARGEQHLVDPFKAHRRRTLTDHLNDYIADLESLGRDPMYAYTVKRRLTVLFEECNWSVYANITTDTFGVWRRRRAKVGSKQGHNAKVSNGASAKTLNDWLATASGFCNWMVDKNRAAANPLARVDKVVGETVRKRRALGDDEVTAIIAAAPATRRLHWEMLLVTGLRVQEAVDLQWQDVKVDAIKPFLSLRASKTKSRVAQTIPLRQDIAAQLRAIQPATYSPAAHVFADFPTLDDWKADLAAAGVKYMDAAGRQADRHSLRTTLGTRLQKAGVPIRVAMELMRHSDIRLTTKVYTDPTAFDLSGAVESLPAVKRPEADAGPARTREIG